MAKQAHLWAVAVGDHQVVVACEWGQGVDGSSDVLLLDLGERDLTSFEQGVPADGDDESHVSPR